VKFLIDNALSLRLADLLRAAGHDTRHVRDRQMQQAADPIIFRWAVEEDRVPVSADTDFGTLLAFHRAAKPSVILFRREWHHPQQQAEAIIANLPQLQTLLDQGAVVIFDRTRIRVRQLPIQSKKLFEKSHAVPSCRSGSL
jgi:predicted nuclease of predicted toxin-antitoxin system